MSRVAWRVRAGVALTLLVSLGCGIRVWEPELSRLPPAAERIPLRVGLYLSPALRMKAASVRPVWGAVAIELERSMVRGFEETTRAAFVGVVDVPTSTPDFVASGIDALVVPDILRLDFTYPGFGATSVSVQTQWSVLDQRGGLLWKDTVTADGVEACSSKPPGQAGAVCANKLFGQVLDNSFRSALGKLLEVKWWQRSERAATALRSDLRRFAEPPSRR